MSEPADFISYGDEFDPAQLDAADRAEKQLVDDLDEAIKRLIEARRLAYATVFSSPGAALVLADLARFCKAFETTWRGNQKEQDLLEGRREVFLRIQTYTKLDIDTLFTKHMRDVNRG